MSTRYDQLFSRVNNSLILWQMAIAALDLAENDLRGATQSFMEELPGNNAVKKIENLSPTDPVIIKNKLPELNKYNTSLKKNVSEFKAAQELCKKYQHLVQTDINAMKEEILGRSEGELPADFIALGVKCNEVDSNFNGKKYLAMNEIGAGILQVKSPEETAEEYASLQLTVENKIDALEKQKFDNKRKAAINALSVIGPEQNSRIFRSTEAVVSANKKFESWKGRRVEDNTFIANLNDANSSESSHPQLLNQQRAYLRSLIVEHRILSAKKVSLSSDVDAEQLSMQISYLKQKIEVVDQLTKNGGLLEPDARYDSAAQIVFKEIIDSSEYRTLMSYYEKPRKEVSVQENDKMTQLKRMLMQINEALSSAETNNDSLSTIRSTISDILTTYSKLTCFKKNIYFPSGPQNISTTGQALSDLAKNILSPTQSISPISQIPSPPRGRAAELTGASGKAPMTPADDDQPKMPPRTGRKP